MHTSTKSLGVPQKSGDQNLQQKLVNKDELSIYHMKSIW